MNITLGDILMKLITAQSSDREIINAINTAGNQKLQHRPHDWPLKTDNSNAKSWIIANDIGKSTRKDRSLFNRLIKMVDDGLLEMKYYINTPRFRAKI